jgi:SPP1 family predicted phage head-tail adaptor
MNIGNLKYNIIIQRLTKNKDVYGSVVETYTNVYNLKANVKYAGGSKTIENDEIFTPLTIIFTTYKRNILESDIILFDNKKFKIYYIDRTFDNIFLEIKTQKINE